MSKTPSHQTPESCPVCGEDVPAGSLACPECGADHNSGWREDADLVDALPDDEFDYDEFVHKEFGHSPKPTHIKPIWWITATLILIAFAAFYLFAR
jgi:hypothetical protein